MFKVGDSVVMSGVGKNTYPDKPINPHSMVGEVHTIRPYFRDYTVGVVWDNKKRNTYRIVDLYFSHPQTPITEADIKELI